MTRSTTFVLGRALAPLSHWRAHPLRHWRRWRHGGIAISAALHVALLAAFTVSLPRLERAQIRDAQAVPVEIVKPPERAQDKAGEVAKPKPPETAKDKRDAPAATKTPEPPAAPRSAAPQPARAAPPPSVRALLQPRQVPGAQRWTMPRPPPFPSATMPSEPRAPS